MVSGICNIYVLITPKVHAYFGVKYVNSYLYMYDISSGSRGGEGAMAPPGPVKIGHKKDGRRRRPHRFHVSRPPPYPAAGSATGYCRWSSAFVKILK